VKNVISVVAMVATFSCLETAFLLCYLLPESEYYLLTVPRHGLLVFTQFLLLPGIAALFSRLIYGRPGWGKRALVIFLAGTVGAPLLLAALLLVLMFIVWAADLSEVFGLVVLPFVIGGMIWALFFAIRQTGRRSVAIEADRWLAERHAGVSARERKLRSLGISCSLWVPALTVLVVILFLPQTWGLVTRLRRPEAARLAGYRVPIPITWIVLSREMDPATGRSVVSGIAGRGCSPLRCLLFQGDFSLFHWGLETEPYSQLMNEDQRYGWLECHPENRSISGPSKLEIPL
jgi:hypothetical protein